MDGKTHIVGVAHTADMQQRPREVAVRHLQPVVQRPQRRAERVRDAREPAARRRVRLEHHEWLAVLLSEERAVEVGLDGANGVAMVEVLGEDGLRVARGSET